MAAVQDAAEAVLGLAGMERAVLAPLACFGETGALGPAFCRQQVYFCALPKNSTFLVLCK